MTLSSGACSGSGSDFLSRGMAGSLTHPAGRRKGIYGVNPLRQLSSAQFGRFSLSQSEQESRRHLRNLGEAVRQLREQRGSTSDELAETLGVEARYVRALEAGERDPDYELLFTLARALDVRPATLIGRAEELAREG
jgi:ribosome-binding protein aMBF1 (putative translation factor)